MAIDAQKIGPFPAFKVANPFAVDPGLPVFINVAMTLTAKPVRLGKSDCLTIRQLQLIAVRGVMAIEAPAFLFRVVQFDGGMLILKFSAFGVCFQTGMAVAAGEDSLGEGRGSDGIFLVRICQHGRSDADYHPDCHQWQPEEKFFH